MQAKRGYVPKDERCFSPEALETLRTASEHIVYLIEHGYGLKQATTFVGDHFQLSERQRLAIMRSVATSEQLECRSTKEVPLGRLHGQGVWVDGFNVIITLEVMLSNSTLLSCMDGTVRDLAALRGTYRIIPVTTDAVRLLYDTLCAAGVRKATILLDKPVSNSGRLKALLADVGEAYPLAVDIDVIDGVDSRLYGQANVITSDSVILDRSASWVNLARHCLKLQGRQAIAVW